MNSSQSAGPTRDTSSASRPRRGDPPARARQAGPDRSDGVVAASGQDAAGAAGSSPAAVLVAAGQAWSGRVGPCGVRVEHPAHHDGKRLGRVLLGIGAVGDGVATPGVPRMRRRRDALALPLLQAPTGGEGGCSRQYQSAGDFEFVEGADQRRGISLDAIGDTVGSPPGGSRWPGSRTARSGRGSSAAGPYVAGGRGSGRVPGRRSRGSWPSQDDHTVGPRTATRSPELARGRAQVGASRRR
jgi:hypothetical protein